MRSRRLEFRGSQGAVLAAKLELPDGPVRAYALFAHCFTCGKDGVAATRIAKALAGYGIGVLRFDFTGLGESSGDFGNTDFSSNVDDLELAAAHLRECFEAPAILIGHSLGGAAVLAVAGRLEEVRAVVTIGAPADPKHVAGLFGEAAEDIERHGRAPVRLGGRTFPIGKGFLDDIAMHKQAECLAGLRAALLVMHSPTDEVVGVEHARKIYDAARHPKSFIALDGADHLLLNREDAEFVASVLATWAAKYVPKLDTAGQDGVVEVSEAGAGLRQTITAGRHVLSADEPKPLGGDTGPTPYDLLLAALGACTAMTLRLYAKRKQLPLDNVTVRLKHSRIHADDCENCETSQKIDRIERIVHLDGDLDDAQRKRLLEIADKCPVHRTLEADVVIETQEAGSGAAPRS